jgi:hypothetical protein
MKTIIGALLLFWVSTPALAVCTGPLTIAELWPRAGGWVHIVAEGVSDIDISNCGTNNRLGMLLNFNDSSGSADGKQMMFSVLLSALMAGRQLQLCSTGCDSQHTNYSRLDHINGFK